MSRPAPGDARRPTGRCLIAMVAAGIAAMLGEPATAAIRTIVVEGMTYTPASVAVRQGDRVVWINRDPFPHTVTATDRAFDSGSIDASRSWTYVASRRGRFDYVCTFHPGMRARLEVK